MSFLSDHFQHFIFLLLRNSMSYYFAAIDGIEVPCVTPLALHFRDLFPELRVCRTHFHQNKEYLDVPLRDVLKNHRQYSFEHFVS